MQKYLISLLINNKLIDEKDKDIYQYGVEIFLLKLMHYLLIIGISLYMKIVIESVIFLVIYNGIRGIIGGYHAKNKLICLLYTALIYFILFLLINSEYLLNTTLLMIFVHFIITIMILYNTRNNFYKNQLYIWMLIILIADVLFCFFGMNKFVISCTYALFMSFLLNLFKDK